MTYSEIKRMCEDLVYYAGHKMSRDDDDEFKRLYQRVKEDDDLDSISLKKLQTIYDKYMKK